uniref:Importin N-terminal domain-containing protein n=1 Tax=Alexandrium monilatum TaxID=311494 RepID=A0A7S4SW61_9DINO|mmetsp:Transcript_45811/g.141759  ORF Transcript_45811/g.141759 Transcript_45811/m.141759 type:complete len:864 (+) Transcript_45811:256-2847(+)
MTSLTELLLATQDAAKCAAAEAQIRQAEQASAEQYISALAAELAGADKPSIARQLSGLLLKNGLSSKDPARDRELKSRWAALPMQTRNRIKEATTSALTAPELDVGKAAAQVLAKIGAIEVPTGEWDGLVPLLLQHVTNKDPRARQVALITLGYLCEELVLLQEEGLSINEAISNNILTAVVQGMKDGDVATKLEATSAFYHAVVLARRNFRNPVEQSVIMEVVCNTCVCQGSEAVQIKAFECLVQIATEYYDFLMPYMNAIGPLTWNTIKSSSEKVAIPAMEFWSTVCDEEIDLADLQALNQAGERKSHNLIKQALTHLVPLLNETLTRQQYEEDDDTWNLAMAAGTCLTLVAQVVQDDCVDLVLSFVQANFVNPDWKYREAAVLAYGSIMEGPSSEKMRPLVMQSYPRLVMALNDQSVAVRDTVSWALGRMAQFHPTIMPVRELMPVLSEKLRDVPRVAANVCWVVQVIAESQPGAPAAQAGQPPATTALSEIFTDIAQSLLEVVARPDADERQLRMAGYNALSVLVSRAGSDCHGHMELLVQEMLRHLMSSFKNVDRECELQGYICGVLTALVQRLRERILPAAEQVMEGSIRVITAYQQVKGGAQVLQEEALLLVAAVANAVGANFERFMPVFATHLRVGLQSYDDVQVCLMATGVVGDLCRALEGKIITYCDTILQILYANLQNSAVDRKIKAAIMSCFGDVALAITGEFEKYLNPVMQMLREASLTRLSHGPAYNEEWVEYLNSLREGVLEAYTSIIHGLRESNKLHLFKEHVNFVLEFVKVVSEEPSPSEPVMKAAVGVVGDLVFAFQAELTTHIIHAPFLMNLVEYSARCQDPGTRQTGSWLQSLLQKYSSPTPC